VLAVSVCGVCFELSGRARIRAFDVSLRNFVNRSLLDLADAVGGIGLFGRVSMNQTTFEAESTKY
jgi:hypothetical protein